MQQEIKNRPKPDNVKPPSLHPRRVAPPLESGCYNSWQWFIFYKYRVNPAIFNTVLIRLQADPKAIGHYLPRPAAAISAKAWTKVFNDGMDQRCVRFEIPSRELENWRSTNSFLRLSKEAVERIFDEWIEMWYLVCRAGGGTRGKHGKSAEARPKCKVRISRSWSFGRKVEKGLIINDFLRMIFFFCVRFFINREVLLLGAWAMRKTNPENGHTVLRGSAGYS